MTEYLNALSHHIFNKSFTDCTLQDVRNLAQQYPYFAPAQFLLLKKLQPDSPEYATQYQRSILYHYNPLEFENFFHPEKFASDFEQDVPVLQPLASEEQEEEVLEELPADSEDQQIAETILGEDVPEEEPVPSHPEPDAVLVPVEAPTADLSVREEVLEAPPEPETNDVREPETPAQEPEPGIPVRTEEPEDDVLTEGETPVDSDEPIAVDTTETETEIPKPEAEPVPMPQADEEPVREEEPAEAQPVPETNEVREPETPAAIPVSTEAPAPVSMPEPGKAQVKDAPAEVIAFEPFHTVDYFASQGIKLSQEEAPKDRFGKQLKSFTEWLKTMKKISPTEPAPSIDSSSENRVQSLASHSVQGSDVVTEAMAEVWIKQGNTHKALDVYNKLSLQNPAKKDYFAAKIETLKKSS